MFLDAILHDSAGNCKRGNGEKDEKIMENLKLILPRFRKSMRSGNFFSGKYDIFNIDRGWYNIGKQFENTIRLFKEREYPAGGPCP